MAGIVIVGAGHAGVQLAASLRDAGYKGAVNLVSADPDLPYHKPPLSKSFMKAPDTPLQVLRAENFYEANEISLTLGRTVARVDVASRSVVLTDGSTQPYDQLVLATGTRARKLSIEGCDLDGVHSLRTAEDARALREELPRARRAVLIGGGFIGLEAAAMLRVRGLEVDVIEQAPRLLGRAVSAPVAQTVADSLTQMGVGLHLSETVIKIEGQGGHVASVTTSSGRLAADLVLVGVGAEPLDNLARDADIATDDGILVDKFLATSAANVHAIGDCVSFPLSLLGRRMRLESVQNATDQARALATTLAGTPTEYTALPWFWSDIGTLKLQIAGLAPEDTEAIHTYAADGKLKSVYHLSDGELVACETINSAGEHMLSRRMIADGFTPPRECMESGELAALKQSYMSQNKDI